MFISLAAISEPKTSAAAQCKEADRVQAAFQYIADFVSNPAQIAASGKRDFSNPDYLQGKQNYSKPRLIGDDLPPRYPFENKAVELNIRRAIEQESPAGITAAFKSSLPKDYFRDPASIKQNRIFLRGNTGSETLDLMTAALKGQEIDGVKVKEIAFDVEASLKAEKEGKMGPLGYVDADGTLILNHRAFDGSPDTKKMWAKIDENSKPCKGR